MKIFDWVLVKEKELDKFFDIADTYFCSFGGMSEENYKFVDRFIRKYRLERIKK